MDKSRVKGKGPTFYGPRSAIDNILICCEIALLLSDQCGWMKDSIISAINSRNYEFFFSTPIVYSHLSPLEAASVRQVFALFTKNASLKTDRNPRMKAMETFVNCEIRCRETNAKFESFSGQLTVDQRGRHSWISKRQMPLLHKSVISTACNIIRDILGDLPSFEDMIFTFGPGNATTVKSRTTPRFKLSAVPVIGKDARNTFAKCYDTLPLWQYLHKGKVRYGYGELSFVPKNAKTDRPIITEPLALMPMQKMYGKHIREKLKEFGVDLDNGWKTNMSLARLGSINGQYCTVDFSSASDLIAFQLVSYLLPWDWFEALANVRSSTFTSRDFGGTYHLEKFSSMGNGFTFELESLIFYALAKACELQFEKKSYTAKNNGNIAIYGDDVVLKTHLFPLFSKVTDYCGFIINNDKSFSTGNFRESCGGDYLNGISIRPFYVKDTMTSARLVGLLNHINASQVNVATSSLTEYIISLIPLRDRNFGIPGTGDGHIHDPNYSCVTWNRKNSGGYHTYYSLKKKNKSFPGNFTVDPFLLDIITACYTVHQRDKILVNEECITITERSDPYIIGAHERCTRQKESVLGFPPNAKDLFWDTDVPTEQIITEILCYAETHFVKKIEFENKVWNGLFFNSDEDPRFSCLK